MKALFSDSSEPGYGRISPATRQLAQEADTTMWLDDWALEYAPAATTEAANRWPDPDPNATPFTPFSFVS